MRARLAAGPGPLGPPADHWSQAAGDDRNRPPNGPSQRYDLGTSVRIFWDLRSQNALPLPALDPETDPELLATRDMPADVERLLSEPLHSRGEQLKDAGAAAGALQSLSLDLPASGGQLGQRPAPQSAAGNDSSAAEPAAAPRAVAEQQAAVPAESPAVALVDPAEEKSWVYQDPAGVLQV